MENQKDEREPKQVTVKLMLDQDIVEFFKKIPDYESLVNKILRDGMRLDTHG